MVVADNLTSEARAENGRALAVALGIDVEQAVQALELSIVVTADPTDAVATLIAEEAAALLSRTVRHVVMRNGAKDVAAELVIGAHAPRSSGTPVYVQVLGGRAIISRSPAEQQHCAAIPRILAVLVACYASAAALYHALKSALPIGLAEPLILDFADLGVDPAMLDRPLDIGRAYLAGAGAVGNGFLWAARHLHLRGELDIVDDDKVAPGNLNRQVWFDTNDVGHYKVDRLATRAQPFFRDLRLSPRQSRLQSLPERSDGPWLRRLIVGVDSRRARRKLQNECPGEVFDASTTDIREIVLHHNLQPTEGACLSCIYEPDEEELSREQHIADHLGVPVDAVRSERISAASAAIIVGRFPELRADALEGMAYDTLFKRLCAQSALPAQEARRVVAPFAFVSVLAGTMLALEIVRRLGCGPAIHDNYWRLSPWHAPLARRRVWRPKQPACEFCSDAILQKVNARLWGDA